MHWDLQIIEYDPAAYRGVNENNEEAINLAVQKGEKLIICQYGHVYDSTGRWIADGMRREKISKNY